ncbi:zinc finger protein JACKDAW-like [Salvia splendens]|uniref:zinc finger protein JACKDAW-like n=1 Tax=Salvia splendens TaxID=180675 RepID=UPI001C254A7D|nr:zinc finger protein JACKDAW-like [Salvia splendens]
MLTNIDPSAAPEPPFSYCHTAAATKRKRHPAGTPDPDAEVVSLSPKTLLESDRYVCEICNQGFQRDQNLQMHRRRHNDKRSGPIHYALEAVEFQSEVVVAVDFERQVVEFELEMVIAVDS